MKPYLLETRDSKDLQTLGKASVQVVHDLKNQINGLKLYATFLRKRMEKTERPPEELETINKLIAGLDRTAADLSLIMEFGHQVEIRKQPGIDLRAMMQTIALSLNAHPPTTGALKGIVAVDAGAEPLLGEFDAVAMSDALKTISIGAIKMPGRSRDQAVTIRINGDGGGSASNAIIEWQGFDDPGHDPFNSLVGSDGLRMALAARVVEAHGGSAERQNATLRVRLPLAGRT